MSGRRYVAWSALAALVLASALVLIVGYYESPLLLPFQLAFVEVPSLVPFAILATMPNRRRLATVLCWAIVAGSGAYVGYVDTRPYQGGGASLAGVLGWMGCGVATLVAATAIAWRAYRD